MCVRVRVRVCVFKVVGCCAAQSHIDGTYTHMYAHKLERNAFVEECTDLLIHAERAHSLTYVHMTHTYWNGRAQVS